jgi:uncharacterized membrane protein YgdD (TMEM256/DUF423 family)
MNKEIVLGGSVLIVLSIALGAFGAHGLKDIVDARGIEVFNTGARYQMYSGLACLIVGLSADKLNFSLKWFYRLQMLGIIIFSLFLYLTALQSILPSAKLFGAIVPIGGVLLIVSWVIFIYKLIKK